MAPSDPARLLLLIQRARWRVRTATFGSPEWDAAVEGLTALERDLRRIEHQSGRPVGGGTDAAPVAG